MASSCTSAHALEPLLGQIPVGLEHEPVVGLHLDAAARGRDPAHERVGVGEAALVKADDGALRPGVDLGDARRAAQPLDLHDVEQVLDLGRHLAEAVDELGGEGLDVGALLERRQAPVEAEPSCRSAT